MSVPVILVRTVVNAQMERIVTPVLARLDIRESIVKPVSFLSHYILVLRQNDEKYSVRHIQVVSLRQHTICSHLIRTDSTLSVGLSHHFEYYINLFRWQKERLFRTFDSLRVKLGVDVIITKSNKSWFLAYTFSNIKCFISHILRFYLQDWSKLVK